MDKKNFNEVLKKQEQEAEELLHERQGEDGEMTLDDTQRVKVLSPGRLVFNRFIRNKLAIVGSVVLIFMFVFSFIFPIFYPYSQTQMFYKYDKVMVNYAQATKRTEYSMVKVGEDGISSSVKNRLNAYITQLETDGLDEMEVTDSDGLNYVIHKEADKIYSLRKDASKEVATLGGAVEIAKYNSMFGQLTLGDGVAEEDGFADAVGKAVQAEKEQFTFNGTGYQLEAGKKGNYSVLRMEDTITYTEETLSQSFEAELMTNLENGSFAVNGTQYSVAEHNGSYVVYELGEKELVAYLTTYGFDAYTGKDAVSDALRTGALQALAEGKTSFEADGSSYRIESGEDEFRIFEAADTEHPAVAVSDMIVRAYSGEDSMEFAFKEELRQVIEQMQESQSLKGTFEYEIPQLDSEGQYEYDEEGNLVKEMTQMNVSNKNGKYTVSCEQVNYLIDIYAAPSAKHLVGTDGDGMDVLARMMYGGRVSLLVCFVVIIIETVLGVILGGIAGYFGGWIDNVIMRLVDIFYCIPSMPILIITGALFDAQKLTPYVRLVWMMVILGVLGWAGVARLVRGQILSLREQEFMVAAESIGLKTRRRIFRHLIPNVMPQLIVTASSGLGSIIITESTLSFLGLGVKHPLATWGTMINSVTSSSENMIRYTYIWVPVGLLICLTVVAFNFVGDGLRDAFDPKMKR